MENRQPTTPEEYRDQLEVSAESAVRVLRPLLNEIADTAIQKGEVYFTAKYAVDDIARGVMQREHLPQEATVLVEANGDMRRYIFTITESMPHNTTKEDSENDARGIRSVELGEDELGIIVRTGVSVGGEGSDDSYMSGNDKDILDHIENSGIHYHEMTHSLTPEDFAVVVEAAQMTGVIENPDPELQNALWRQARQLDTHST